MAPLHLSFKEFRARPLRTCLTLGSVVIGVAAIVSVSMTTSASKIAQVMMAKAIAGNAALEIQAEGGGLFDRGLEEKVRAVDGVSAVSPIVRRFCVLRLPEGKAARLQVMGIDLEKDEPFRSFKITQGRTLENQGEILLDASFAHSAKVTVDSEVRIQTVSGMRNGLVVGLTKPSGTGAVAQGSVAIIAMETAEAWFRSRGRIELIQVAVEKEDELDAVRSRIHEVLPQGIGVRQPAMRSSSVDEMLVPTQQGLLTATVFSLIIAVFIIYNTFQMNVGERRRQLGVLRALGMTRREVTLMILREGAIIGCVGIVLGWIVGILGAYFLCAAIEKVLLVDLPRFNVTTSALLTSATCGMIVMFFGAFFPARRAGAMSPSEAMRIVSVNDFEPPSYFLASIGLAISTLGLIVLFASMYGYISILFSTTFSVVTLLGCLLILPAFLGPLSQIILQLFQRFWGVEGIMARRQLLRHRGRTALTIGVLFMATSTGLAMSSTILDNIRDIKQWYERAIVGDFFVRAAMPDMATGQSAEMPADTADQLAKIDGIIRFDSLRFVKVRSDENTIILVVREYKSDLQVYFDLVEGDEKRVVEQLRGGGVVLSSVLALRTGYKLGDQIPLETTQGKVQFPIVGICNDYIAGGLTLYIHREQAKEHWGVEGSDVYVIQSDEDKSLQVEQSLRELCDKNELMLQSYRDLVEFIHSLMNGVVASLWAVLALGTAIAAFGLMNTLAMSIQEQTREIGMLRVVAMTRGQVRKMVLAQALFMAVIAVGPGVPAGLLIAYFMNLSTRPLTGHAIAYTIRADLLIGIVCVEFLVVTIAALLPAERAVRLRLSQALQYE